MKIIKNIVPVVKIIGTLKPQKSIFWKVLQRGVTTS